MRSAPSLVCPRSDTSTESGLAPSIAVLKSSRVRPIKNQTGWGNLPSHPLHLILSNVLNNLQLDIWRCIPEGAFAVAIAIARRNWLSDMRLVSSGWSNSVNSHPFWADLIPVIRPDIVSVPGGPSFYTARAMTTDVCIPCRLSSSTLPPQCAPYRMPTDSLGRIRTCQAHWGQICSHCLRVQTIDSGAEPNLFLRRALNGDVDERGRTRNCEGLLCAPCREVAFNATVRRDLEICARGSEIRGFDNAWQHTISFKEHVYFGTGRSTDMAKLAIEDWFLMQHTTYYQLLTEVGTVQALLRKYRMQVYEHRSFQPPPYEMSQIARMVWNMFDEDDQNAFDLPRLYRRWCHEIESKQYDEYEYRLDIERVRHNLSAASLWPWLRNKILNRTLDLWAQERFINGYWVMPSDEIAQMLDPNKQIHTPLHEMALEATRIADYGKPSVADRWRTGGGRFRFNANSQELRPREQRNTDHFLPPERLLGIIDMRFSEAVSLRLDTVFAEIMRYYTRVPYKEYDRIEAHLDTLDVKKLVTLLEEPYPWFEMEDNTGRWPVNIFPLPPAPEATAALSVPDDEDSEELSLAQRGDMLRGAQNGITGNADSRDDGDIDSSAPREPWIELVPTNDDRPPSYGIIDGWSTASDEPLEFEEQPEDRASERSDMDSVGGSSIGSRKTGGTLKETDDEAEHEAGPAPRSRLGSGQTSASGESTNTALVTPDESPSLLAEERIQVADVPDTVADSMSAATMGVSTTSPGASPTLGKRKSPDDDDLIRPPRRPASIPVSTHTTASEATNDDDEMEEEHAKADEPEAGTRPATETEEGKAKPGLAIDGDVDTDHSPMDEDAGESEAKPNPGSDKVPSAQSDNGGEEIDKIGPPLRKQPADVGATEGADGAWSGDASEYSDLLYDSQSEASFDSERLADMPSVPSASALLGPGMCELIESSWFGSRAKLRVCHCSVCVRAKREAAEAERRRYMEEEDDNIIVASILRIA